MMNATQLRWLWHNFSIPVTLLFVFDSPVCRCYMRLKAPQKNSALCHAIADDFAQLRSLLWFFTKNSSSPVKSLLNFLMLFSYYFCFWKNWVFFLLRIPVKCIRNELKGSVQVHSKGTSLLYPNTMRCRCSFLQLRTRSVWTHHIEKFT